MAPPCPVRSDPTLLTIYNGGHPLTDTGAIMKLRIKQSGLQKTQEQKSSPSHWHDHSHALEIALKTRDSRAALLLSTSQLAFLRQGLLSNLG